MARSFYSSITGKFMLPLTGALLALYFVVETPWIQKEMRSLAEDQSRRFAHSIAELTLDALNTMMLSGDISERRDIFIKKLNSWEDVREVRLFRSPKNEKQFPAKGPHDRPIDDIDRKAIETAESYMSVMEDEGGRYLRAVIPFIARENYHGTRCMDCHEVKEGDVLGGLSIKLDLKPAEKAISSFRANFVTFNAVIIALIIALLYYALRRLIVNPIKITTERINDIIEGEGDLTRRIEIKSDDEIADLARAFNRFSERIREMISKVTNLSENVAVSSSELTVSSEQIATGVRGQNERINNAVYVIKEMTSTIDNISINAEKSATMSKNVLDDAYNGAGEVDKSIKEMRFIDETVRRAARDVEALSGSTRQIGEIINLIDYIADQTNLLALNASIEAARAGEQGKGFSVVAEEIRKLAERTTKATKEIAQTVDKIQREASMVVGSMNVGTTEVQKGVEMSDKAGAALRKIVDSIRDVVDQINQIAVSVEQQSASTKSIADNITSVEQISHETATGAEESARAANDLNMIAMELDSLVKKFKI